MKRRHARENPIDWAVQRFGIKREFIIWSLFPEYASHEWDGTKDPLKVIADALSSTDKKFIAVEGGVGVSKTFWLAVLCLWFLENYDNAQVFLIATREKQIEMNLWKEISTLHPKFGLGELQTLTLKMKPPQKVWSIVGMAAPVSAEDKNTTATSIHGLHAANMLIVTDETPGIENAVIEALVNTCTAPNNKLVALGNPNSQNDTLHKFYKREDVVKVTISGYDYPNVVTKNDGLIPGGQTRSGLANLLVSYKSERHPLYISRARGKSPEQSVHALIKLEWIEAAIKRWRLRQNKSLKGEPALGVDVANSETGDEAAKARGIGATLVEIESKQCPRADKLGEEVAADMKIHSILAKNVGVDGVGVGVSTVNKLYELEHKIVNIQSAGKAVETIRGKKFVEEFDNLRSQMWWTLADDLKDGYQNIDNEDAENYIALPPDDEMLTDLITPNWELKGKKIIVESKKQFKQRLGRSPNKGDAVVYWNFVRSEKLKKKKASADGIASAVGSER